MWPVTFSVTVRFLFIGIRWEVFEDEICCRQTDRQTDGRTDGPNFFLFIHTAYLARITHENLFSHNFIVEHSTRGLYGETWRILIRSSSIQFSLSRLIYVRAPLMKTFLCLNANDNLSLPSSSVTFPELRQCHLPRLPKHDVQDAAEKRAIT
jgi:hypothetical protein